VFAVAVNGGAGRPGVGNSANSSGSDDCAKPGNGSAKAGEDDGDPESGNDEGDVEADDGDAEADDDGAGCPAAVPAPPCRLGSAAAAEAEPGTWRTALDLAAASTRTGPNPEVPSVTPRPPSKASAATMTTTLSTPGLPDFLLMRFLMPLFTTKRVHGTRQASQPTTKHASGNHSTRELETHT
jgi:hypothetical protein